MHTQRPDLTKNLRIKRYGFILALMWTAVVFVMALWALYGSRQDATRSAHIEARATFEKDLLYRRWATMHGGVYVPITDETPPNPYLDVPNRDVTTTDGLNLTLINPAYMTRQVHELAQELYGTRGHITSLDPIRPGNAPDAWETEALQAFADGVTEVSGIETVNGQPVMRYMRAMITEEDCLKCHAAQGYELGDIRGGISVMVPMQPYWDANNQMQYGIVLGHGIVWLLGLAGIVVSTRWQLASARREEAALIDWQHSETRYRQMFENNRAIKLAIDPETGTIVDANHAAADFYGYPLAKLKAMRIHDLIVLPDTEIRAHLDETLQQGHSHYIFQNRLAAGTVCDVEAFNTVIEHEQRRLIHAIVIDITARREAEAHQQALVEHLRFLNRTGMEMLALDDEDSLYTYMGHQLHHLLAGEAVIIVNQSSEDGTGFVTQGVYGIDETQLGRVASLLNYSPVGITYKTDPLLSPYLERGELVQFEGGLVELAKRVVPPVITRQLVRWFNLGEIYLIGLQYEGAFYAGVQIYMRGGRTIDNPDLVNTFVQQVSVNLQRVKAEAARRQSEDRYRMLADHSNDIIALQDLEGRIQYLSPAHQRITGYTPDERMGQTPTEMIHPDDRNLFMRAYRRCLDERVPFRQTVRFRKQNGDYIWLEIYAQLVLDAGGQPHQIITNLRDVTDRIQFEEALRESEGLLRAFIEQSNDGIVLVNEQAQVIEWNAAQERITGINRDAALGQSLAVVQGWNAPDGTSPEKTEQIERMIQQMLAGDHMLWLTTPTETAMRHQDGTPITIQSTIFPIHTGETRLLGSIIRDVTERKQMEERLRRYRNIVSSTDDGIALVNRDYVYEIVNDAYLERTQLERHEIEGHHAVIVLGHEGFDRSVKPHFDRCLEGETVRYADWFSYPTGQRYMQVTYYPYQNTQGDIDGVVANVRDITELWQARHDLEQANAQLESSVEAARIAWWEMDIASGRVQFDDRKALMLGYKPEDFVDPTYHAFTDLLHPDDHEPVMQAMRDLLDGNADLYATDYRLQAADGRWMWFHDRGELAVTPDGRRVVRGFVIDITERQEMQQRQFDLQMEKERVQMLTTFIQNTAHEFRTPLTGIGMAAYMMSRSSDHDQRTQKAEQIETHVGRITRLLDMLLTMVRIESQAEPLRQPVQFSELIAAACDSMRSHYGDQPALSCTCADELPVVLGDAGELAEALHHILDNAYRFTPADGTITVNSGADDSGVWLDVQDTGAGIPDDALPHIFETFWRQDSAHSTPGFGLGLSIARRIVQQHGGEIIVDSQPGQGTRVRIMLPHPAVKGVKSTMAHCS